VERRLAITYIVSATTTFGVACVAIAAASGGLFASASPKPAAPKQVEIVDNYIVVHSSATTVVDPAAADTATASVASPRSALVRIPVPAPAAAPPAVASAPSIAPAEVVAVEAPKAAAPPAPAPETVQMPEAVQPPSSEDAPAPARAADPPPTHTSEPAPAAPGPAARPPIPPGCHDPEFRNGTWKCDDD
jgi:hypothetical protein